ncbi:MULTISPECIES: hypothetical protein [Caballeronia]|nr:MULTISPECIES: hypothetical protein [Caballeronia]
MYKAGGYFVECIPTKDDCHGWRCVVRFSRKSDFLKGGTVRRVTRVSPSIMQTSVAAEYAAVLWARRYVETNQEQLEAALSQ